MGIKQGARMGAGAESWRSRNRVTSGGARALSIVSNIIGSILMLIGAFLLLLTMAVEDGGNWIPDALLVLGGMALVYGGHWCAIQLDKRLTQRKK